MKLVIAEKPSVAQSLARVIGADKRQDGYLEGGGYLVSWCVGHLVELSAPERYDERLAKWRMPFMSKEDCSVLFEKSLAANDEKPGVDGKLYLKAVSYVGEETLSKLVDRYIEGGFENIKMDNIYPYLSSADVKRIFYYELRK